MKINFSRSGGNERRYIILCCRFNQFWLKPTQHVMVCKPELCETKEREKKMFNMSIAA